MVTGVVVYVEKERTLVGVAAEASDSGASVRVASSDGSKAIDVKLLWVDIADKHL